MALFLFIRFHLILLTFGYYLNRNGPFLPVKAVANVEIPGPLINISVPPPHTVLVQQNSSALLSCTVSIENTIVTNKSEHDLDILWYKNNKKLLKRNEYVIYENGSLKLPFNENVNGIYFCLVNATQKGLGVIVSSESSVTYAVLKRLNTATKLFAKPGMYLQLDCPFKSVPPANITWKFKNFTTNYKKGFYMIDDRFFQLQNGSLLITLVKEEDRGNYKCIAENQFSIKPHRQLTFNISTDEVEDNEESITVQTIPNIGSLLPPLQNKFIYIPSSNNIRLQCLSNSEDTTIEWWFISKKFNYVPIKISNHSYELFLNNASADKHNGTYQCSTGVETQSFDVFITIPPRIEEPLKSYESSLAATVSLSCSATGNPAPEIIWFRDGVQLKNSYTMNYIPPFLRIYSVDLIDEGIYQCFAKNLIGVTSTIGQIRLVNKKDLSTIPGKPENVQCYPVNYKTLNVTFHSKSALFMMNIHIVTKNPFKWNSTMPIQIQSNSYVIISNDLPVLKPFMLFLRGLVATSTIQTLAGIGQTFDPSLLSEGVECATQGLVVNGIFFSNGVFIWWSKVKFLIAKYFIIQIKNNKDELIMDNTNLFKDNVAIGTTKTIDIYKTKNDIEKFLHKIPIINEKFYNSTINITNTMRKSNKNISINSNISYNDDADDNGLNLEENIKNSDGATTTNESFYDNLFFINSPNALFSLISSSSLSSSSSSLTNLFVPGNVSGILIPNITNITVRVLVITNENEHLKQDLKYLEWKTIENSTKTDFVFNITSVESRNVNIAWNSAGGLSCLNVCYHSLTIDIIIRGDQQKHCQHIDDGSSQFTIKKLKPLTTYRIDFMDCKQAEHLGTTEVQTKADPPGPITNQRIITNEGLKLLWDPPINPNGEISYYLIHWTFQNQTYEANVTDGDRFFEFPNITMTDKINASVRVVGASGIGPPIYIDLRNFELIKASDKDKLPEYDYTLGIIIGILLSVLCIMVFILIFLYQRTRFKRRNRSSSLMGATTLNRTSPSEQNFSITPTAASIELHEMQTLIPSSQHQQQNFRIHSHQSQQQHQQQQQQQQQQRNPQYQPSYDLMDDNNELPTFRAIPNGNSIFQRMKSASNFVNSIKTDHQQCQNQIPDYSLSSSSSSSSSLPPNIFSSTPLVERRTKNGRKKDLSEILLEENRPQFYNEKFDDGSNDCDYDVNNDDYCQKDLKINEKLNDFSRLSSLQNKTFINSNLSSPVSLKNGNLINLQNGSIKTLLPLNQHSINALNTNAASESQSSQSLLSTEDKLNMQNKRSGNTIDSNANTSIFDNSQQNLLKNVSGNNLLAAQHQNLSTNEISCTTSNSDLNLHKNDASNAANTTTATTFLSNLNDSVKDNQTIFNNTNLNTFQKSIWNCHDIQQPIIDPNG